MDPEQDDLANRYLGETGAVFGKWRSRLSGGVCSARTRLFGFSFGDGDEEGEKEDEDEEERPSRGVGRLCPRLWAWFSARVGTRKKFAIISTAILAETVARGLSEYTSTTELPANEMGIQFFTSCFIVLLALSCQFATEGRLEWSRIVNSHFATCWLIPGLLMAASYAIDSARPDTAMESAFTALLRNSSVIWAIVLSILLFKRRYGKLEVLAVAMMLFSVDTVILLRYRCVDVNCGLLGVFVQVADWPIIVFKIVGSAFLFVLAMNLSERVCKGKGEGLFIVNNIDIFAGDRESIYVLLASAGMLYASLTGVIWVITSTTGTFGNMADGVDLTNPPKWFENWTLAKYVAAIARAWQLWMWFLLLRHFDSVSWSVVQLLSLALYLPVYDWWFQQYHLKERLLESHMMTIVLVLSAVIFQTGRLNLKWIKQYLKSIKAPETQEIAIVPSTDEESDDAHGSKNKVILFVSMYSAVIVYILSQGIREILGQRAKSGGVIVPASLDIMNAFCGMLLALALTYSQQGPEYFWKALDMGKVQKFLPCGFLLALTAFLGSMAFALGISAAAKDCLGRVYTPVAALLSRWITHKSYMWLEWTALAILTLSCMTFSMLDTLGEESQTSSIAGMLCALGSGTVSACNSLVMERLMKTESDPFVVQLVRLNAANLIFSGLFLFVFGYIGDHESPPRPDLAYWNYRPLSEECAAIGTCDMLGVFIPGKGVSAMGIAADCACGKGIFVGWGSWVVYGALFSSMLYSWVTGLVVRQFSSVMRSVADGIMLLVLFNFLAPAFEGMPFPPRDLAMELVVLVVPLSGAVFSIAASELEKVSKAVEAGRASDAKDADGEDEAGEMENELEVNSYSPYEPANHVSPQPLLRQR
eukprot:TRINITY_DN48153_c0_g1_i1.p1 TRINITY_DN48153_c0_g1~~TRINITY_DN48153_c0_g1_i1.p1  ORF type:complete len:1016 (+),score=165.42 TRINITY_DN48153_c0_g1_i1:427-3048(+)